MHAHDLSVTGRDDDQVENRAASGIAWFTGKVAGAVTSFSNVVCVRIDRADGHRRTAPNHANPLEVFVVSV